MFRSAVVRRCLAAAPTPARRTFVTAPVALVRAARAARVSAVSAVRVPAAAAVAAPASLVTGRRWYSAGGGLTKDEVEGRILSLLQGFDKVNDASNIKPTAHFANDLGLDSLDTVEVVMAIEEEFSIEIPDKDADTILTVDKAVDYILHQPDAH